MLKRLGIIAMAWVVAALGIWGLQGGAAVSAPSAVDLVPHRAFYHMALEQVDRGIGLLGVDGVMVYEFADRCEGWTEEQKSLVNMDFGERGSIESKWSYVSWESKDGQNFRFRTWHERNGQVVSQLEGSSEVHEDGGQATFRLPEGRELELSPAVVFPADYLAGIIAAANSGKRIYSTTMFDGGSLDSPYLVNAVISKAKLSDMDSGNVYPVRMAFFPAGSRSAEPAFELDIDYRSNGIAERIVQEFSDYAIRMKLDRVELLAKPDC